MSATSYAPRASRWRALLLLAALLPSVAIAAAPARAEPPAREPGRAALQPSQGHFAELWRRTRTLAALEQGALQSDRDFLLDAAAWVDALTAALAAEVCGVFERPDGSARLVITLVTQGSPAFCLFPQRPAEPAAEPANAAPIAARAGLSIHSHVGARSRRAHPRCAHRRADDGPGVAIRYLGDRFSVADIDAGPGFLVHRGRLWHQHGLGTQRFVARLEPETPAPASMLAQLTDPPQASCA